MKDGEKKSEHIQRLQNYAKFTAEIKNEVDTLILSFNSKSTSIFL